MSMRLQVLLDEAELREIQDFARRHRMTVSEWVRESLRQARASQPAHDASRKLDAIRSAAHHEFPAGEIGDILRDIERGYLEDESS